MPQSAPDNHATLSPYTQLGLMLLMTALADTAARSALRTWVDLYWHNNIHRYAGPLLMWVAVAYCAAGAGCLLWSLASRSRRAPQAALWRWGTRFVLAGNGGFVVAALCQAMMHLAGLSGPYGGELHPRSLTLSSSAAVAFGVVLLALASQRRVYRM